MTYIAIVPIIIAVLALSPQQSRSTHAEAIVITAAAPIFLMPDANRPPLRTAAANSRLRVLLQEADWYQVEFQDPQHGRRVGWIEAKNVRVAHDASEPVDVSIPRDLPSTSTLVEGGTPAPGPITTSINPTPHTKPAGNSFSDEDLSAAIALGNRFKKHDDFLEDGLKPYKIRMSSAMALDGMSKYLAVLTDWTTVAAASADAKRQLRTFTLDDARSVPASGLVHVIVEIHARGLIPTNRINGKYGDGKAHLVLQFGDENVQPLDTRLLSERSSAFYYGWNYTVVTFGNMGWIVGGPAGWREKKYVMSFSYQLTPDQMRRTARAILIDSNSGQDSVSVDFSRLR